jgi:hypothetical protein
LKNEHCYELTKTILATSICSDEVSQSVSKFRVHVSLPKPFQLGGLAGFPFTGITGFNAFAGHIPDDGFAIIVYGPHIGISGSDQPGKVLRSGQLLETSCCGALLGILNQFTTEGSNMPDQDLDYQQWTLTHQLDEIQQSVSTMDEPLINMTDLMFIQINKRIKKLIDKTKGQFKGKKVALIGGVIINTDTGLPDWFDEREFSVHTF